MVCIVGLDLGTTGCKSTLFDENGRILGESYMEYGLNVRTPVEVEQDPEEWWSLSKQAIAEAVSRAKVEKLSIKALSISSQGIAFVPVDAACRPLYPAISWLDTRSSGQVDEIRLKIDEGVLFSITGKRNSAAYVLPKIMWLKEHKPDIYRNTFKFLMAHDFIVARLTGHYETDHTMAAGTLLYDIQKLTWSEELAQTFGIDLEKLPAIKWSGEYVGTILGSIAEEIGLSPETAVFTGAQDQKAAAFAARLDRDAATISLGTAGAMEFLFDRPVLDEEMRLPCFPYVQKGTWALEAVVSTSGASLKWLRNTLLPEFSYAEIDRLCARSAPGAGGIFFLPHLTGATSPHWKPEARGMFYGISLDTTRDDIIRSVLEGIAFQFKANIQVAENLGSRAGKLKIFGGGAKSRIWCEMIASLTGKTVLSYASPEIATMGAGLIAAAGYGLDTLTFGREVLEKQTVFEPVPWIVEQYEHCFRLYQDIEATILNRRGIHG